MENLYIKLKTYISHISGKGHQYITNVKQVNSIGKLNALNIQIIHKDKALPLIINNYMLRLLTTYKEEAQTNYQATLTRVNSSSLQQKGDLNKQLYEISENIKIIDKALAQYELERKLLEKEISLCIGLTTITTIVKTKK
jgi:hypothetical protein